MERWFIACALLLVALGGALGLRAARGGHRSSWTATLMLLACCLQLIALGLRGEMRGACPLKDAGEVLLFLAWSLTLFYLLVGPAYRISLLGLFSTPVVVVLLAGSSWPGALGSLPDLPQKADSWHEAHAALSVLSYGALALASVAGSMFLTLNHFLKRKDVTGGVCETLPSVSHLLTSMRRLFFLGLLMLTGGVVTGFVAEGNGVSQHFWAALAVWGAYFVLWLVLVRRGLAPRWLAILLVSLFLCSLVVFTLL